MYWGALTGNKFSTFALAEATDPIKMACELSELARILGGEFVPRPANTGHRIFCFRLTNHQHRQRRMRQHFLRFAAQ